MTTIVTALAIGAAAGLKPTAEKAIKDAYSGIKALIRRKYSRVSVDMLENDPASEDRKKIVKEDLKKTNADSDLELLSLTKELLDALQRYAPETAGAVGVDLEDIKAGSVKIEDIIATGTGVKMTKADIDRDLEIKKVRAGDSGDSPPKKIAAADLKQPFAAIAFQDVNAGRNIIINISDIQPQEFARLAGELGVTKAALRSFFRILEESEVPAEELDGTLREIAKRYKQLVERLQRFRSDDPEVNALKRKASEVLQAGYFDQAEALLNQASERDVEVAKELQEVAERRWLSAADSKAENGDLKYTQLAYAEAAVYYCQAAELVPENVGEVLAKHTNLCGVALWEAGHYKEAERALNRALAIRKKVLGPEHPDVAQSLNNLAVLYNCQGEYAEAEPFCQRALEILEKVLGPEHTDVATSLNILAELYREQGRYVEAEPLYQRALTIREKVLGPEHPDVATVLGNLALLYYARGNYQESELLHRMALTIREKVLGTEHPDVATNHSNLGVLYQEQGRDAQAEQLYLRALEIREKVLGPKHPDVAISLNCLAGLYHVQARFREAEPLYLRALEILEKLLGLEHPDVATSLNNLGELHREQGRDAQAEQLHLRALEIREKVLGSEHPDVLDSLNNLALLYHLQGKYREAEPLYLRALETREKVFGAEHPDVATSLNNLAGFHHSQREYTKAEPLYHRALQILKKTLGPEHPKTVSCRKNLAQLYRDQGR